MDIYTDECILYFLENQSRLFDDPVAGNFEEAKEFLEDCMAVVLEDIDEVREYLKESGMDVSALDDEELAEEAEVFTIPDGTYLIVEG